MPSTKEIKRRIKSVKSTKKITKAMELVAASKMKRAIAQTLASRLYAACSLEILQSLSTRLENSTNSFFVENSSNKYLLILITSNRGLCGGYNTQVVKKTINMLRASLALGSDAKSISVDIVAVGKKGDTAMRRIGQSVVSTFTDMPETIDLTDTITLSTYALNEFSTGKYGKVYVAFTDFVSALNQKPEIRKILPVTKEAVKGVIDLSLNGSVEKESVAENKIETSYLIEGDTEVILNTLVEKLVRMQVYQMILESNASEQSSRMTAMKNASDAAGEMIDDLTLVFNKARQSGITREISEISAGMANPV
jgi:F-type H+-transporting ATPase subunit gamma